MRAEDLRTGEIFVPRGEGGFPLFAGSRIMIMGTRSLGQMQEDIFRILGEKEADALFLRHGYEAGLATAMAMADLYDWDSDEEWIKAGLALCSVTGLAHEKIESFSFNPTGKRILMEGTWRDSLEATQWLRQRGKSPAPVCRILSGWASGYASACLGTEVWVREISCRAQGHRVCRFEGKPMSEWDLEPEAMEPFRALAGMEETMGRLRSQLQEAWREVESHRAALRGLKRQWGDPEPDLGFVFRSEAMARIKALAERAAVTDAAVLVSGEGGTGKEALVRLIHRLSTRRDKPFMVADCAALPEQLLESELFGHVRGAFPGADHDKKGLLAEAGEGTLFLDEVDALPFTLQAKLQRALQEKKARPMGGAIEEEVHARILAATKHDLKKWVQEKRFREDLYYLLNVIPIHIPPLHRRRKDILPLARHFLEGFQAGHPGFSPESVRRMTSYSWPGNVRELENAVEHAVVLAAESRVLPEHLPEALLDEEENPLENLLSDLPTQEEMIRRYTEWVLKRTGGNRTQAAKILNVHVSTIWRRLKTER